MDKNNFFISFILIISGLYFLFLVFLFNDLVLWRNIVTGIMIFLPVMYFIPEVNQFVRNYVLKEKLVPIRKRTEHEWERISSMSLTILAALLALGSIKFSNSMSLGMYVFAIFILALSYFICELIISQYRGYTNVRIREDIITRKRRRGE